MIRVHAALAAALIAEQFPEWAGLAVRPVEQGGWDNRTSHLGTEFIIRMPSAAHYAGQVQKEQHWLPRLAPHVPLAIPKPVAMGMPGQGYPFHWSVYAYLPGGPAAPDLIAKDQAFAAALGVFLRSLQAIPAEGGPGPGEENFHRGGRLEVYDAEARAAFASLAGAYDGSALTDMWERGLASRWTAAPVWVHGDIAPGNLLMREGALSAVIDFGQLAVGDPACDLAMAWTAFDMAARDAFRRALPLDEETWHRGQCWALWKAAILASGLVRGRPSEMKQASQTLHKVLQLWRQTR